VQKVSPERLKIAEAEWVPVHEGSMFATVTRGGDAPPGSRTVSRTKGRHRNPGDPTGSDGMVAVGGVARGRTGARRRAEVGSRIDS